MPLGSFSAPSSQSLAWCRLCGLAAHISSCLHLCYRCLPCLPSAAASAAVAVMGCKPSPARAVPHPLLCCSYTPAVFPEYDDAEKLKAAVPLASCRQPGVLTYPQQQACMRCLAQRTREGCLAQNANTYYGAGAAGLGLLPSLSACAACSCIARTPAAAAGAALAAIHHCCTRPNMPAAPPAAPPAARRPRVVHVGGQGAGQGGQVRPGGERPLDPRHVAR